MKKLIIVISVIFLLLGAACSKDTNTELAKGGKPVKAKQADGHPPDVMNRAKVNPNDIFSVSRDGNIATLEILIDFSACKRIAVARNATGFYKDVPDVGDLASNTHQFEDILPNSGPFYYWIRIYPPSGDSKTFGPIRVGSDVGNKGTYSNIEETYLWLVSRTYTSATITWNFPEIKYRKISIKRNTSTRAAKRKEVHDTLEWDGNFVDTFPDPEADYWYWIEATLENGRIINQGPIKAGYPSN
jgi:hypothetical protein